MTPAQKTASAQRRVTARHSIIDALQITLEGLPVSIRESGSLRFGADVTDSQFDEIAKIITKFGAQSTTLVNFAKSDLWDLAVKRYGGGIELMKRIYGDTDLAHRQSACWRGLCIIGRRVPEQDRDMSRNWSYYRFEYDGAECKHMVNECGALTLYEFKLGGKDDTMSFDWEERSGKPMHKDFPFGPIKQEVIRRCTDPITGEINLD